MNNKGNKLLYALLALVISFSLWVYVVMVENPEYEDTFENIPVTLANELALRDRGLINLSDNVPAVTLKLSGNRSNINKLSSSNITLIADLSRIYETCEQKLSYNIIFPGDIPPNSISIQNQDPATVTLTIVERKTKEVNVNVVYNGSVPEDYIADKDNPVLDHTKISVTGPDFVIDQIDHALVEVDLEGVNENISQSYQYTLCNAAGEAVDTEQVVTNVSEVKVTLKVQRVKEVQLLLNVIYGADLSQSNTTVKLDPKTIKISGSNSILEKLDSITIGTLDLTTLLEDQEFTFSINENLPDGVTNLTGMNEVTVSVDIPEMAAKELRVSTFQAVNVPDGMKVEFITKILDVRVRGNRQQINDITADDVIVRVNFANAELGDDQYKPQITIAPGFDSIGVIEAPNVYATVTEIVEEEE